MNTPDFTMPKVERLGVRWSLVLVGALSALTAVHLYLAFHFPLAEDETYYWEWSRRLAWGYYDQSPGIAWAIRGFCLLFGDTEIGIRMSSIVSSLLTQVFAFFLARNLFGNRAAFLSILPFAIAPIALAGGFLATYDSLLVLFWTLGLYFLSRCLFFSSRWSWLGVGICFGLGLQSKYLMALFGFCLLCYCFLAPGEKRWLKSPFAWGSFVLGSAMLIPNIVWLNANGWITLSHVSNLTSKTVNKGFLSRLGDFLATQAVIVGPICFILFIISFVWLYRKAKRDRSHEHWLIFAFSVPMFLLFLLATLRGEVLANWTATAWVTGSVAIGCYLDSLFERRYRLAKRTYIFCVVASVVVAILIVSPELASKLGMKLPVNATRQLNKMYGGTELAQAVTQSLSEMRSESKVKVFIAGTHYGISSRLAFYLPGQPEVACLLLGVRLNQYLFWNDTLLPKKGENMLVVTSQANDSPKRVPLEKVFERVVPLEPVPIYWKEMYEAPVRNYYVFKCYGYSPHPELMTKPGERTGY